MNKRSDQLRSASGGTSRLKTRLDLMNDVYPYLSLFTPLQAFNQPLYTRLTYVPLIQLGWRAAHMIYMMCRRIRDVGTSTTSVLCRHERQNTQRGTDHNINCRIISYLCVLLNQYSCVRAHASQEEPIHSCVLSSLIDSRAHTAMLA